MLVLIKDVISLVFKLFYFLKNGDALYFLLQDNMPSTAMVMLDFDTSWVRNVTY